MTVIDKNPQQTLQFNPEKCSELLEKLIIAFQEYKPTVGEILVIYGNLGYTLGASIEGETKGPDIESLKQKYYTNPSVGAALMLQGIEITNWFQDHEQQTSKKERE
tara:strand:- start:10223 stop:10540 length:318 start_codon:yes stop_codon:yes gene_type:complete